MIYKNTTPPPIALYGADADNFLESCGIELYEDSIAIGESLFDGYDGECLLNENGIFLYEDGIVLEGKQVEEYLKRKMEEKEKNDNENINNRAKYDNRYGGSAPRKTFSDGYDAYVKKFATDRNPAYESGRQMRGYRKSYKEVMPKAITKSEKRLEDAEDKENNANRYGYNTAAKQRKRYESDYEFQVAADAARRHYRRTHKNESTIFDSIKIV